MSVYLEDVYATLRAAILTAIPGVEPGGIWEGEDADSVPWEQMTPPLAAIIVPDLAESEDGGTANLAYECNAEVYYAAETESGMAALRAPLEALRDYLWSADPEAMSAFAARYPGFWNANPLLLRDSNAAAKTASPSVRSTASRSSTTGSSSFWRSRRSAAGWGSSPRRWRRAFRMGLSSGSNTLRISSQL